MRGKEDVIYEPRVMLRITPAYAGKRTCRYAQPGHGWDHPRVCGEKYWAQLSSRCALGSPPRMRGKVSRLYALADKEGITPAYAGKRALFCGLSAAYRDHPRVCGEKSFNGNSSSVYGGSPPRMRGKAWTAGKTRSASRITPAYAGKSHRFRYRPAARLDHPRVCGEKFSTPPQLVIRLGSPPRMRGKAGIKKDKGVAARITPAYAGKSFVVLRCYADKGDHPRVCGEKVLCPCIGCFWLGSPPRMRGKAHRAKSKF